MVGPPHPTSERALANAASGFGMAIPIVYFLMKACSRYTNFF
jgi:hypothetical protein